MLNSITSLLGLSDSNKSRNNNNNRDNNNSANNNTNTSRNAGYTSSSEHHAGGGNGSALYYHQQHSLTMPPVTTRNRGASVPSRGPSPGPPATGSGATFGAGYGNNPYTPHNYNNANTGAGAGTGAASSNIPMGGQRGSPAVSALPSGSTSFLPNSPPAAGGGSYNSAAHKADTAHNLRVALAGSYPLQPQRAQHTGFLHTPAAQLSPNANDDYDEFADDRDPTARYRSAAYGNNGAGASAGGVSMGGRQDGGGASAGAGLSSLMHPITAVKNRIFSSSVTTNAIAPAGGAAASVTFPGDDDMHFYADDRELACTYTGLSEQDTVSRLLQAGVAVADSITLARIANALRRRPQALLAVANEFGVRAASVEDIYSSNSAASAQAQEKPVSRRSTPALLPPSASPALPDGGSASATAAPDAAAAAAVESADKEASPAAAAAPVTAAPVSVAAATASRFTTATAGMPPTKIATAALLEMARARAPTVFAPCSVPLPLALYGAAAGVGCGSSDAAAAIAAEIASATDAATAAVANATAAADDSKADNANDGESNSLTSPAVGFFYPGLTFVPADPDPASASAAALLAGSAATVAASAAAASASAAVLAVRATGAAGLLQRAAATAVTAPATAAAAAASPRGALSAAAAADFALMAVATADADADLSAYVTTVSAAKSPATAAAAAGAGAANGVAPAGLVFYTNRPFESAARAWTRCDRCRDLDDDNDDDDDGSEADGGADDAKCACAPLPSALSPMVTVTTSTGTTTTVSANGTGTGSAKGKHVAGPRNAAAAAAAASAAAAAAAAARDGNGTGYGNASGNGVRRNNACSMSSTAALVTPVQPVTVSPAAAAAAVSAAATAVLSAAGAHAGSAVLHLRGGFPYLPSHYPLFTEMAHSAHLVHGGNAARMRVDVLRTLQRGSKLIRIGFACSALSLMRVSRDLKYLYWPCPRATRPPAGPLPKASPAAAAAALAAALAEAGPGKQALVELADLSSARTHRVYTGFFRPADEDPSAEDQQYVGYRRIPLEAITAVLPGAQSSRFLQANYLASAAAAAAAASESVNDPLADCDDEDAVNSRARSIAAARLSGSGGVLGLGGSDPRLTPFTFSIHYAFPEPQPVPDYGGRTKEQAAAAAAARAAEAAVEATVAAAEEEAEEEDAIRPYGHAFGYTGERIRKAVVYATNNKDSAESAAADAGESSNETPSASQESDAAGSASASASAAAESAVKPDDAASASPASDAASASSPADGSPAGAERPMPRVRMVHKSLDLAAVDGNEFVIWLVGLSLIRAKLAAAPPDVVAAVGSLPAWVTVERKYPSILTLIDAETKQPAEKTLDALDVVASSTQDEGPRVVPPSPLRPVAAPRVARGSPASANLPMATIEAIIAQGPKRSAPCRWRRVFSLVADGASSDAVFTKLADAPYSLFVVKDSRSRVFGGYAAAPWPARKDLGYFGSNDAFVWRVVPDSRPRSASANRAAAGASSTPGAGSGGAFASALTALAEGSLEVYQWQTQVSHHTLSDGRGFGWGGGGGVALYVNNDLAEGRTDWSGTYQNPPLNASPSNGAGADDTAVVAKKNGDGTEGGRPFRIFDVEVWAGSPW